MSAAILPCLDEPRAPAGTRALGLAVVLGLHLAVVAWLLQMAPASPLASPARPMDVRIIETPPRAPPRPAEPAKPVAASPKPLLQAKQPLVRPAPPSLPQPVHTAPAQTTSTPAPFAIAPQPKQDVAPAQAIAPAPVVATPARFDADYLNNPAPAYPSASRRLHEEGTVLLLVRVSPNGEAEGVQIKQGSGHARLDEAAVRTVQQWRFVPARRGSETIAASVMVPIVFRLDG